MLITGLFSQSIAQIFSKTVWQFCIHTGTIYESYRCPASMLSDVFLISDILIVMSGFPEGSDSTDFTGSTGDSGLIPGSRRSPGGGNGNSLQCSCLENPMDRGAWWATVHGTTQGRTRLKQLITIGILWYFIVVFICIFLMSNHVFNIHIFIIFFPYIVRYYF